MVYCTGFQGRGELAVEIVSGVSSWKLTIRREAAGITLLRGVTCDEQAVLPETLFGLPVTALGDHALSPSAGKTEGEQVLVTCGRPPRKKRRGITAACGAWRFRRGWAGWGSMPFQLRRAETLELYDGIGFWGGGALMNCRSLDTVRLTRISEEQGISLAYFADELSRELDVTVTETDGTAARLIFPEFLEVYEENCPAHHFDYTICGAGYPYHHCFRQKKLSWKEYDQLWSGYLGMEHDEDTALRLCWWRLRCPKGLTDRAAAGYTAYLRDNAVRAAEWLVERGDPEGLAFLLRQTDVEQAALSALCETARRGADRGPGRAAGRVSPAVSRPRRRALRALKKRGGQALEPEKKDLSASGGKFCCFPAMRCI